MNTKPTAVVQCFRDRRRVADDRWTTSLELRFGHRSPEERQRVHPSGVGIDESGSWCSQPGCISSRPRWWSIVKRTVVARAPRRRGRRPTSRNTSRSRAGDRAPRLPDRLRTVRCPSSGGMKPFAASATAWSFGSTMPTSWPRLESCGRLRASTHASTGCAPTRPGRATSTSIMPLSSGMREHVEMVLLHRGDDVRRDVLRREPGLHRGAHERRASVPRPPAGAPLRGSSTTARRCSWRRAADRSTDTPMPGRK